MKKILTDSNKSPNFIGSWNIENDKLCDEIIKFFEENKSLQNKGMIGIKIDPKKKQTIYININPSQLKDPKYSLFNSYFDLLNNCFLDYKNQYTFLKQMFKVAYATITKPQNPSNNYIKEQFLLFQQS